METDKYEIDMEKFDIAKDAVGAKHIEMERSVFFGENDFYSGGSSV